MSARNINPNQLKMFMSPREIIKAGTVLNDTGQSFKSIKQMQRHPEMDYKSFMAKESPLHDSIGSEGVKKPVNIVHHKYGEDGELLDTPQMALANGHHRLVSQSQHDPDRLMPVLHHTPRYEGIDWSDRDDDPTGDKPIGDMAGKDDFWQQYGTS